MASRVCSRCIRICAAIATFAAAASSSLPCLADVEISVAENAETINVVADHASFDDILNKLGEHFKFGVERASDAKVNSAAVSLTLSGTLDAVLKRLLRNRNYLIVRRPDNTGEIDKVVILTATEGAPPPKPASAVPTASPAPPAVPPGAVPPSAKRR